MIIEDKEQFFKDWLETQTTETRDGDLLPLEAVKELVFDLIDNLGRED